MRVSFKFDDGSWMKHAFVYDWRVWPVSEMRSVMAEAGFSRSVVCVVIRTIIAGIWVAFVRECQQ
eukprot:COSAG04_NODE_3063_length_3213_cov_2.861316_4_plen_65_part_00